MYGYPSERTQAYDVGRRSGARGDSHDMGGGGVPGERVASEAASPGLLWEAGLALLSPVSRGPTGGVIVGKRLVGRPGGATLHGACGDELRSRRGVEGEIVVEQLKVVIGPSRATDRGAVIPIHEIARAGGGEGIVTSSKPPLGLGVGEVKVVGIAARVYPNKGARQKCTTRKDPEEQTLAPVHAEVSVLDPGVAVIGSPQGMEAGNDRSPSRRRMGRARLG
jgi:hypothetical protein